MSSRFPVALVAIGVALSLWATGVLTLDQSLAGFGDPTVLFIASLFVVSDALNAAGVTAWVEQMLLARAGAGRGRVVAPVERCQDYELDDGVGHASTAARKGWPRS